MTDPTTSEPQLLPKLHEARRLSEAARWGLLDLVILLDEIEADVLRAGQARLHAALQNLDVVGPGANAGAHAAEEYQPDDDCSCGGDAA